MTLAEQTAGQSRPTETFPAEAEGRRAQPRARDAINVGRDERVVSVAAGSLLAALGLSRGNLPGLVVAAVGGGLIHRGYTGRCYAYGALGIDTAHEEVRQEDYDERGVHVEASYTILKSPEELYSYWRNFENLPRIMSHLESVKVIDERRSHWVAKAPAIAGGTVEWDAEITRDEPNAAIAWRSLPGADVPSSGEVRFLKAPGDRGTEVHATFDYIPPAGNVGRWVAKLFGEEPQQQVQEDLRNFKRTMETGEIPTILGQPRGTCRGTGKHHDRSW